MQSIQKKEHQSVCATSTEKHHISSRLCVYFLKLTDSKCDHVFTIWRQFYQPHDLLSHGSVDTTPATILIPSEWQESWSEFSADNTVRYISEHSDVHCWSKVSLVRSQRWCSLRKSHVCYAHTPTLAAEPASPFFTFDLSSFGPLCLSGHYISTKQRGNVSLCLSQRERGGIYVYVESYCYPEQLQIKKKITYTVTV